MRKITVVMAMGLLVFVTGCATTQVMPRPSSEKVATGRSRVIVFRPSGFVGGGNGAAIYANGNIVGTLYPKGELSWDAEPGLLCLTNEWTLGGEPGSVRDLLEPDKVYRFKCEIWHNLEPCQPINREGIVQYERHHREAAGSASPDAATKKPESPSPDPSSKVVSVARLDYDWRTGQGAGLNGLSVFLGGNGIVGNKASKSGWVNIKTSGSYHDDAGALREIVVEDVCFWVNNGGKNWWDFSVGRVLRDGQPLPFTTSIDNLGDGSNRPVLTIEGKYKLIPNEVGLRFAFKEQGK